MQHSHHTTQKATRRRAILNSAAAVALAVAFTGGTARAGGATYTWLLVNNNDPWSTSTWLPDLTAPINNPGDIATSTGGTIVLDTNVTIGQLYSSSPSWAVSKAGSGGPYYLTLDNTGGVANPLGGSNTFLGATSAGYLSFQTNVKLTGDVDIAAMSTGYIGLTSTASLSGTGDIYVKSTGSGSTTLYNITTTGDVLLRNSSGSGLVKLYNVNNAGRLINTSTSTSEQAIYKGDSNVTEIIQDSPTSRMSFYSNSPNLTAPITIKSGSISTQSNYSGTGLITLGASGRTDDAALMLSGSLPNNITFATGSTANLSIQSATTSAGSSSLSGQITLNGHDLVLSQFGSRVINLWTGANFIGTGDVVFDDQSAGARQIATWNNTGAIINRGSTNAGTGNVVSIEGALGATLTQIVQESTGTIFSLKNSGTDFTGPVLIKAGTLRQNTNASLSASNTVVVNAGATYELDVNTDPTIGGLNNGVDGSGSVFHLYTGTGAHNLTLGGGGAYSFGGTLAAANPSGLRLTKSGTGTQVLTGNNLYTGSTTIKGGALIVNGSLAESIVTVNSGGTLGGSGKIGGATTINSAAILSPGNSPGTITFGSNLLLGNGSILDFEGGDRVVVDGALSLNSGWNMLLGAGFTDGGSVVAFDYGSQGSSFSLAGVVFNIDNLGFTPTSSLVLTDTGSQIVLNGISVVPEPGSLTLLAGAAASLLLRRRKRLATV